MAEVLSEGFEGTGLPSGWTATAGSGSTLGYDASIPGSPGVNLGSQCLQIDRSSNNAYIYSSFGDENAMWARCYFYIDSANTTDPTTAATIMRCTDSSAGTVWSIQYIYASSDHRLKLFYRQSAGTTDYGNISTITRDAWHCLECSYSVTADTCKVWLDDTLIVDLTNANGTRTPNRLQLGPDATGQALRLYIDAAVVNDAERVGPLAANELSQIEGSTTFTHSASGDINDATSPEIEGTITVTHSVSGELDPIIAEAEGTINTSHTVTGDIENNGFALAPVSINPGQTGRMPEHAPRGRARAVRIYDTLITAGPADDRDKIYRKVDGGEWEELASLFGSTTCMIRDSHGNVYHFMTGGSSIVFRKFAYNVQKANFPTYTTICAWDDSIVMNDYRSMCATIDKFENIYVFTSKRVDYSGTYLERVYMLKSTDLGATWSTPVMVSDNSSIHHHYFPCAEVDKNNHLIFVHSQWGMGPGNRAQAQGGYFYKSTDGGNTWGSAVSLLPESDFWGGQNNTLIAHPITGHYYVFDQGSVAYSGPNNNGLGVRISTDGGASFGTRIVLDHHQYAIYADAFGGIDTNGWVYVHYRSNKHTQTVFHYSKLLRSKDNFQTYEVLDEYYPGPNYHVPGGMQLRYQTWHGGGGPLEWFWGQATTEGEADVDHVITQADDFEWYYDINPAIQMYDGTYDIEGETEVTHTASGEGILFSEIEGSTTVTHSADGDLTNKTLISETSGQFGDITGAIATSPIVAANLSLQFTEITGSIATAPVVAATISGQFSAITGIVDSDITVDTDCTGQFSVITGAVSSNTEVKTEVLGQLSDITGIITDVSSCETTVSGQFSDVTGGVISRVGGTTVSGQFGDITGAIQNIMTVSGTVTGQFSSITGSIVSTTTGRTESVVALITQNLVDSLHNKSIVYNGSTYTTTADTQRTRLVVNDRYPFIEVSGPQVEVIGRAHRSCNCKLNYLVELREARINDDYSSTEDVSTITEVTRNVHADLVKMIMADRTRGGYAFNTEYDSFGYYFDGDPSQLEMVVYVTVAVEAAINDTDPYYGG